MGQVLTAQSTVQKIQASDMLSDAVPSPSLPLTRIGPVLIATLSRDNALTFAETLITRRSFAMLAFCNAHSVNLARHDPTFAAAMASAFVLNDGIGVDLARHLLIGAAFPDNLNGTDFTPALLNRVDTPLRIFLLGGKPGIAEQAAQALRESYPRHDIVGWHDGYFNEHDTLYILRRVAEARADLVLVGMGQPRQEVWVARHCGDSRALWMCIGAYLDFVAGAFPRAPIWVRRLRVEWAFRLIQEPRRLARRYIIGNGHFIASIVKDKFSIK